LTDMAKQRTRRYSIEIKDNSGKTVVFTAADWTDDEKRIAVGQILGLAELSATGLPH
jgi:hypothetical protein